MTPEAKGGEAGRLDVVDGRFVLVDYGPMVMHIIASDHGTPLVDLAKEGGRLAFAVLGDVARFLPLLKRKALTIENEPSFPPVVARMVEACRKMEAADLTPLAAVAGASSDVVADYLIKRGGTKVIVDNGGDVAVRLKGDETARVGIKTEIDAGKPAYAVAIDASMGVGGVATSGLGGRSFTKGIASAVTVLSRDAALADAAATAIGNETNVEDPAIRRYLPETVYPDTDIAGEWVTGTVGRLAGERIDEALRRGLTKAENLIGKGHIRGALICVKGRVVWTDSIGPWLKRL